MASDPITTDELIKARIDQTGLTREQLLLVVAKSALVTNACTSSSGAAQSNLPPSSLTYPSSEAITA